MPRSTSICAFAFVLALAVSVPLEAFPIRTLPDGYTRRVWQMADGLPENTVQAFAQTPVSYTHLDVYKRQVLVKVIVAVVPRYTLPTDRFIGLQYPVLLFALAITVVSSLLLGSAYILLRVHAGFK